jgi:hypothetical protein
LGLHNYRRQQQQKPPPPPPKKEIKKIKIKKSMRSPSLSLAAQASAA